MEQQHFHIKNMVCEHCGEVLRQKLLEAGFPVKHIELGKLELNHPVDSDEFERLSKVVRQNGFEIISDRNSQIVEQIKHLIIDIIHQRETLDGNLSEFLEQRMHKDYQHLSRLFSGVEGKSIERYFILQKIERAKELIVYGKQNLTEIAYELDYSSQQHFSRQFKKETGLSPSHFKEIKENKRTSIDQI
ncbi:helix-turn-helix domain-containing protein [Fodinibius sp. SL11]|uniref:helix-turn-helix domain-containing protein n=1 Tax=Fodinibius sp. SL11 TaxID=3425690 RepID=UPI003F881FA6